MNRDKIIKLYDLYGTLLTNKQQEYFKYYYFEDLSLTEISENLNVSKTIISKTINTITKKLNEYENKIKLNELHTKLTKIQETTKDTNTKKELEKLI